MKLQLPKIGDIWNYSTLNSNFKVKDINNNYILFNNIKDPINLFFKSNLLIGMKRQ